MSRTEISNVGRCLDLRDRKDGLTDWCSIYLETQVSQGNTYRAKKGDLQKFLAFFSTFTGDTNATPDQWTKSVTEGFREYLLKSKGLAPSTINRVLATLKHAASWIHGQRPFLVGNPTAGVRGIAEDEPEWRGLTDLQVNRLICASEQLVAIQKRASQLPYRNKAMLLLLLHTGLRASELLGLNFPDNFDGTSLRNVQRKGTKVTRKLRVPTRAGQAIEEYLERERGNPPGPLFRSPQGRSLATSNLNDALSRIAAQANSTLPKEQHIRVTAHMLRHTALRKAAEKDIRHALRLSGHSSSKYIWRYVQPDEMEFDDAMEDLYR